MTDKEGHEGNYDLGGAIHYGTCVVPFIMMTKEEIEKIERLLSRSDGERECSKAEYSSMKVDFEERINSTYLANNFPLPGTVLGSEYITPREPGNEILGNSWKGTLALGCRCIFPLN